jgi:opacity protein-like surface antigen
MKAPLIIISIACLLLTASAASAEWFVDLYAGQSFTEKSDVTVHSAAGLGVFRDVEFERSLAYGGRLGRYFDGVPFIGFGVDVSRFSPRIGPQRVRVDGCVPSGGCGGGQGGTNALDVDVIAISPDVILRLPLLKTDKAPWGSLQPYVTAGVPLFWTTITPRTTARFRNHDDDSDLSFGYKFGGGLAVQVASNLMLFGEYRLTHVQPAVELRDAATLHHAPVRTDLDTHTLLLGISARW